MSVFGFFLQKTCFTLRSSWRWITNCYRKFAGAKFAAQIFFGQVWGNSGKIPFAPPKICLLLHDCVLPSTNNYLDCSLRCSYRYRHFSFPGRQKTARKFEAVAKEQEIPWKSSKLYGSAGGTRRSTTCSDPRRWPWLHGCSRHKRRRLATHYAVVISKSTLWAEELSRLNTVEDYFNQYSAAYYAGWGSYPETDNSWTCASFNMMISSLAWNYAQNHKLLHYHQLFAGLTAARCMLSFFSSKKRALQKISLPGQFFKKIT